MRCELHFCVSGIVSDIAIFEMKMDIKLQLTYVSGFVDFIMFSNDGARVV